MGHFETMRIFIFIFFLFLNSFLPATEFFQPQISDSIISTKQIKVDEFSCIWNPSLIKIDEGFLVTFRYCLAPKFPWISYVGAMLLDNNLEPISCAKLLATRNEKDRTSSQAEDARLFTYKGEIYLLYNDNVSDENPKWFHRRDMYLAKILINGDSIDLSKPLKLIHAEKYTHTRIQKNWVPIEWKGQLLLAYSMNPHELLIPNLETGECQKMCETSFSCDWWKWGEWRGGTPAVLDEGEYLGFFHSSNIVASEASNGITMYHYYMGAYTFSSSPPFKIKRASKQPIVGEGFYTKSPYDKRVIFPGGLAIVGPKVYVAYGKDDSELWIATIDKNKLKCSMKTVKNHE